MVLMILLIVQRKILVLTLLRERQNFVQVWIAVLKIVNFQANRSVTYASQFCLGSISNKFDYVQLEEVSIKGRIYDFLVDF